MISFLDQCVDTKNKRQSLIRILAILLILYMSFTYIRLAKQILMVDTYEDMYALLQVTSIKETYIARVLIACLGLASLQMVELLKILCFSLRFVDILTLACVLFLANKKRAHNTYFRLVFSISIGSLFVCVLLALPGLQATTLFMALTQMKYIAAVFLLGGGSVLLLMCYLLFRYERIAYKEALLYHVEEILE